METTGNIRCNFKLIAILLRLERSKSNDGIQAGLRDPLKKPRRVSPFDWDLI